MLLLFVLDFFQKIMRSKDFNLRIREILYIASYDIVNILCES